MFQPKATNFNVFQRNYTEREPREESVTAIEDTNWKGVQNSLS